MRYDIGTDMYDHDVYADFVSPIYVVPVRKRLSIPAFKKSLV